MNAHQLGMINKPQTIGELRSLLDQMEAAWSEEDTLYLGIFNDQGLYVSTDQGIDRSYMQFHGEFGLIAFPNG